MSIDFLPTVALISRQVGIFRQVAVPKEKEVEAAGRAVPVVNRVRITAPFLGACGVGFGATRKDSGLKLIADEGEGPM